MKAIIFAGGVGTRLWPLSRKSSPKQFEKVIGDKSTLQLAVERLLPNFNWKDIYISTNERYVQLLFRQLPGLVKENIISEPEARDVGPAVGLATAFLFKNNPYTPIVVLWSDHIIKNTELFKNILQTCNQIISKKKDKLIFITQKPRFPSQNLGWIKFSDISFKKNRLDFRKFSKFIYRPNLTQAEAFFKSSQYTWNIGYFVTTPFFLWKLYQDFQPELFSGLNNIYRTIGTKKYTETLLKIYPNLPKISFDNAILEKIDESKAYVLSQDLGWSDVGAWEALKEAIQPSQEQNVVQGKVVVTDCRDSLVYNYTDQLVVTIDLDGHLVVNTHDVVLICHKNSVPKIKKLVENLAKSDNEHLV